MDAILSGQAGLAVLIAKDEFLAIAPHIPAPSPCRPEDIESMFADATDVETVLDASLAEVRQRLAVATSRSRALQISLILLDRSEDSETARLAALSLSDLLANDDMSSFVANTLYSFPLPPTADIDRAISLLMGVSARRLFTVLRGHQHAIRHCRRAWDFLDSDRIGGERNKAAFESAATQLGLFRELAIAFDERRNTLTALQPFMTQPVLQQVQDAAQILRQLTSQVDDASSVPRVDASGRTLHAPAERPRNITTLNQRVVVLLERLSPAWSEEERGDVLAWLAEPPQLKRLLTHALYYSGPPTAVADAEDIVQEFFASGLPNALSHYHPAKGTLWPFLLTILRRRCWDYARRRRHEAANVSLPLLEDPEIDIAAPPVIADPEDMLRRLELRNTFHAALDTLSSADRSLIQWRLLGLTSDEVAARLNITPMSARMRSFRAMQKLRAVLKPRTDSTEEW